MDLTEAINIALAGLTAGAIYALLAMGYDVIFATTGVLNFAHGELMMVGTMVGVGLFGDRGWPVLIALTATVLFAGALGAVEERTAVRPATSRGHGALGWVLATLGFAIILRSAFALIMGPDIRVFPSFVSDDPVDVGGVLLNPQQLLVIGVALAMAVLLHVLYRRTLLGQALSAVAADPEAAAMRGIPVGRLSTISFALGSAIAGLTGFVAGPITAAFPTIGFGFALKGFIAAAVGGIPEIRGALVGGLLLGLIEAFGVHWIGAGFRDAVVFVALLAMLAVRPGGLLGRAAVRSV